MTNCLRDNLAEIIELCELQIAIVQNTGQRPCKDEFMGLMAAIAAKAKREKANGREKVHD
jgi:hypothetical protein